MYAVDLHNHTRFFHRYDRVGRTFDPVGVRLLLAMARYRNLDGVALTNHDYYRSFGRSSTVDEWSKGPATIPGIEISTTEGHVVVVGPNPPECTEPGSLTPAEVVDLAHDRGCVAIVAHPFRHGLAYESDAPFDAIEVNGKHPRTWPRTEKLADRLGLPLVGGSDSHYPVEVGRAYTLVDVDRLTPESLVDAIRAGRVEPHVNYGLSTRLIRTFYRFIHQNKGHFRQSKVSDIVER